MVLPPLLALRRRLLLLLLVQAIGTYNKCNALSVRALCWDNVVVVVVVVVVGGAGGGGAVLALAQIRPFSPPPVDRP